MSRLEDSPALVHERGRLDSVGTPPAVTQAMAAPLEEALRRARRGDATPRELADALARLPELILVERPAEAFDFLTELGVPPGMALPSPDGVLPMVFTDPQLAEAWVSAQPFAGSLALERRATVEHLRDCLASDAAGVAFDEGAAHALRLSREALTRLYALLSIEQLAARGILQVVTDRGAMLVQPGADGAAEMLAYESTDAAAEGVLRLHELRPTIATQPCDVGALVAFAGSTGVARIVVDAALPTARLLGVDELAAAAHASPPPMVAASGIAVPPAGRRDDDARALFESYRRSAAVDSLSAAEWIEALAFEIDLWVPAAGLPAGGRAWPQIWPHPSEPGRRVVHASTEESVARALVAANPPGERRLVHATGVELLRWIWACPAPIDALAIDAHTGTGGWAVAPSAWVLPAVYPLCHEVADLGHVTPVPVEGLGRLAGARGLKPEVVRALLAAWPRLACGDAIVEHDGRHWLGAQVASSDLHATAPFTDWLAAARDVAGILLTTPDGRPLPLEHVDLAMLDAWVRLEGRQPDGGDLVVTTRRLLDAGRIPATLAARLVADWPRWYLGLETDTGSAQLLTIPGRADCCALFSTAERAAAFLHDHRARGVPIPCAMQPTPVLHRWDWSAFHTVRDEFACGWLDPEVGGDGGLLLDRTMMAAAIDRIVERLTPRLP